MNFGLYVGLREILEQYSPIVSSNKYGDTLTIKKINLKVFISNYSNFVSLNTIKDKCNVEIIGFDEIRSDSQKLSDFKISLPKAIKIAKLEISRVESFSVQRVKGLSRLEELQKGGYKILVNNDIGFRFSHVKIHEDNIALGLQGNIVKVFHGDEAKEVLAECAKFEDLRLMERY